MDSRTYTTIGLRRVTKAHLDEMRAPGQSYDGFMGELIKLWSRIHDPDIRFRYPPHDVPNTEVDSTYRLLTSSTEEVKPQNKKTKTTRLK